MHVCVFVWVCMCVCFQALENGDSTLLNEVKESKLDLTNDSTLSDITPFSPLQNGGNNLEPDSSTRSSAGKWGILDKMLSLYMPLTHLGPRGGV